MSHCPLDPRLFIAVAMSGEQQDPDTPACVWIDASRCSAKHTALTDVSPPEFQEGLKRIYQEDGSSFFIIVHKQEKQLHVFKFPKSEGPRALAAISVSQPERSE